MEKTKIAILLWIFLQSGTFSLKAQYPEGRYQNLEELIESLAETTEGEEEYTLLVDELHELHENQIDINSCRKEELLKIPFVNEISAEQIIRYREKYGSFLSVFEVASVPGIGRDLAEKISFFVFAGEAGSAHGKGMAGKKWDDHDLLTRLSLAFPVSEEYHSHGEKPRAYPGSPVKVLSRYFFEHSSGIQAGLIADKDPGESFFSGHNKSGFDFYSAHLSIATRSRVSRIILGDYTARSGQGLVLWQGFPVGKSSDVIQISKNMSRIKPYTSSDENFFFRGVAAAIGWKRSRLDLFLSSKKADANVDIKDSVVGITSLQTSGYHRTESEFQDKRSEQHSVAGFIFNLSGKNFKAGITSMYEIFRLPVLPGDRLYEKFHFSGRENFNVGADYRWVKNRFQFYGEAAVSRSKGIALIQGVEARVHDQVHFSFAFRHFDKNYHATWASAFASERKAINETGVYTGIRILPAAGVTLSGYADWFRSPWIRYTTASPSTGHDIFLQTDFRFNRYFSGYLRAGERFREAGDHSGNLYTSHNETKRYCRFQMKYSLFSNFLAHTRLEANQFKSTGRELGILVYHDFSWAPERIPFSAVMGAAWFRTGSFDTRIYLYESDMLYTFSTLPLYGKGIRGFLKLHVKLTQKLEGWIKTAGTFYSGEKIPVTGNDNPAGKTKGEFKIQLRCRF